MTGKTHRAGGTLCAFAGYFLLKENGMLINGIEPIVQFAVMYPFAIWGSTVSDLDHHAESAPSKDVISMGINRVLHLTTKVRKTSKAIDPIGVFDAKHRSWQTHSDLFLGIFMFLFYQVAFVMQQNMNTNTLRMILTGLILGIISHVILDMLTPEGIWSILFVLINKVANTKLPEKIKIIPVSFIKWIGKRKLFRKLHIEPIKFFATDGPWEKLINRILWVLNFICFVLLLIELSPYKIEFNFM